jgi:SOS response regulatory protein OraA/RecX
VAKANYQYQSEFARKYVEEGRQEGHVAGTRRTLQKLLRLKFGALSPETEARLAAATEAELDLWTERILTATSLDVVFGES